MTRLLRVTRNLWPPIRRDCLATKRAATEGRPTNKDATGLDYRWLDVLAPVFLLVKASAGGNKGRVNTIRGRSPDCRLCIQGVFER